MYRKKQSIDSLQEGSLVDDIFVVKIKKGLFQYKNGYFFHVILTDISGRSMDCKYWGGTDSEQVKGIYDSIEPDSVVYVQGKVQSYGGKLQISTGEQFEVRVLKTGEYEPSDFIRKPKRALDDMWNDLKSFISRVSDTELKKMLESIFYDNEIMEKFRKHPGSIQIHHNWIGGLMQHTLEVTRYCEMSAEIFPFMNKDILIAGALLHDIGKLEELEVTTRIKGSVAGQLEGHITQGAIFLSKRMEGSGLSNEMKDKLLHIMISHHGRTEYGSPKVPMFPEAVAVYYADEMSSKLTAIIEFVAGAREITEDEFMFSRQRGMNILVR